ncbi:YihY/virulence factor BrkB family protein [Sanguibacter sp. Z1732]|uniref:YihY/virulence factor BrkB family protein n=1 Tax=Sanguibacter sp. Z1732 TaxID=3435412 RepID=UPI003D9C8EC0
MKRGVVVLFVAVVLTGFVVAATFRRYSPMRTWLSPAATTILSVFGSFTSGLSLMEVTHAPWRPVISLGGAAAAGLLLSHLGAAINHFGLDPLRRYRAARAPDQDLMTRIQHRVEGREDRERRINLVSLTFRSVRRVQEVRVTGLAAEMTYYGLISLVPLGLALGSSLGFLERILGPEQVGQIEQSLIEAVATVFASDVTDEVLVPLIEGLLAQERAGVAIGSVLAALWLASRMFRAAIRALDDAYAVQERRAFLSLQALGLVLAFGAVITLLALVAMVVVGPLLGGGREIADQFGLGAFFEIAWGVLRWPAVAAVVALYLTMLYRYGPNVDTVWTRCLPGAVLGTILLIGISLGFGQYLAYTGTSVLEGDPVQDSAVQAAAQTVGLVLAGVLWMWLSSIALLTGGVLNAELQHKTGRDAAERDATEDPGEREAPEGAGERDNPAPDVART